jgi:mannose-1-phosphate guanylyltransferase/mannose-6-phosphate isomerase
MNSGYVTLARKGDRMSALYPIILCGGSGSRLWPLSRESYPKQFLRVRGSVSLLQETVQRLQGLPGASAPTLVCGESSRFLVLEQLCALEMSPATVLLEPVARNTAPALTIAALQLQAQDPEALLLVSPADHVIEPSAALHQAVAQGLPLANAGHIVIFGIQPTAPETGYGYIQRGPGTTVKAFVEKPNAETATQYVSSGEYLWNSGMCLLKASVWLSEMERLAPEILHACQAAIHGGKADGAFFRVAAEAFGSSPSQSLDYAVLERTPLTAVIPLDAQWSDVGCWAALHEVLPQDEQGNVLHGDVIAVDTHNSLIAAHSRLVAAVGVENLVIVETADAVLVTPPDRTQEVRAIVERLQAAKRPEAETHRRVYRPWGYYESLDQGERFQVKRILVKPGEALSLQHHHHRSEHWIVVRGTAQVTRGEEQFLLSENQSTYIPLGVTHRLENPGSIPLELIEVQSGSYLGEDDIVRLEDRYQRK